MSTAIHTTGRSPVKYKDFWVKIVGSLLASEIIDSVGRDESIFRRLTSFHFYTDLLGGFVIALVLWEIIRFVTRRLDLHYDWFGKPVQRVLLQFAFGVLTPALLSFFFTLVFMKLAYNQDIFETQWLTNEFYTVILIIILINLVYFTWWLYHRSNSISVEIQENQLVTGSEPVISDVSTRSAVLQVTKGEKNFLLVHDEIAYVFLDGGYTYIKTRSGDSFVSTYTLDELSRLFDPLGFFRVNRQIIISRHSCKSYQSIENGKIQVELLQETRFPVIVSQKRARDFRKWIAALTTQDLYT